MLRICLFIGSLFTVYQVYSQNMASKDNVVALSSAEGNSGPNILFPPEVSEVMRSREENITEQMLFETDNDIRIGNEAIEEVKKLPTLIPSEREHYNLLSPSSYPKEVSALVHSLDPKTTQGLYNKLNELPEGKVVPKVQELLSLPELQDPQKLSQALESMKIEPLSALAHSIDLNTVTQIAKESFNPEISAKEPLKILTHAAAGETKEAAEAMANYGSIVKKLVSPEGVSKMFGDAVVDKIAETNQPKIRKLDENYLSAITYELTQKGYSRSDVKKILGHLDEKMKESVKKANDGDFAGAAQAMLEHEMTLKQFNLNEIYNVEKIDPNAVERFAQMLGKEEIHPTHKRLLETEKDLHAHGVMENLASGNLGQTLLKSETLLAANAEKTKIALANALAARLNITNPADKRRLVAKIESSSSYNMLIKYTSQAFQNSIRNAVQSHHDGDSEAAARHAAEAAYHLSITKDPKELDKITNSLLGDIVNGGFSSFAEESKKNAEKENNKGHGITSLAALQYVPPEDKPVVLRHLPQEVIDQRERVHIEARERFNAHANITLGHTSHIGSIHNLKASVLRKKE